jgi:hypothetical protein
MEAKINAKTTKLFDLSGTQAVILLAFNELDVSDPFITFDKLQEVSELDPAELKKQLISLSMLEHKLLLLQDEKASVQVVKAAAEETPLVMAKAKSFKKTIAKADKFSVNRNFRSKMRRIQINSI